MRKSNYFMIILFLSIISLPLILNFFNIKIDLKSAENRDLTAKPVFSFNTKPVSVKNHLTAVYREIIKYKNNYSTYYTDNFILKPLLFRFYVMIKSGIFLTNPLPDKVVEGDHNWMFLGDDYSHSILESKGLDVFSQDETDTIISHFSQRQKWLEQKGIKYFIAVAPNKETVYGNYLPIKKKNIKTKLEQLKSGTLATGVKLIDLGELLNSKSDTALYYKTDSHWNNLGAFWGYTKLMKEIKVYYPGLNTLQLSDFTIDTSPIYHNDLTNMLNISRRDDNIILKNKAPLAVQIPSTLPVPAHYSKNPKDYEKRYRSKTNNIKILIFRDSFSNALIQYVRESFGESVFIWDYGFNKDLIEKEKPDIVISEIVEREL